MSGISIRSYMDGDQNALLECLVELQNFERRLYDRLADPRDIAASYFTDMQELCARQNGRIFVVEVKGAVAGYVAVQASVSNADSDELAYDYARISDVIVLDRFRGLGLGRKLLERAEKFCREQNASMIRISVLAKNHVARNLYSDLGFTDHLVVMEKKIGD